MPDNLKLSWAIPLSVAQLGARLMAYVISKATIAAFDKAKEEAPHGSAVSNAPPESLSI